MNKTRNIIIIAVFLLVAVTFNVMLLTGGKEHRQEIEIKEERTRTNDVVMCQDKALSDAYYHWERECSSRGWGTDCSLPSSVAKVVQDNKSESLDRCIKTFK